MLCCGNMCVNHMTDEAHCGACFNACRIDQFCDNGTCSCFGSMQECAGSCVDLQADEDHCGVCRNSCGEWMTCCQGSCTDLQTDDSNCGRCGNVCVENSYCVAGMCSEPCGGAWCDGECVNLEVSNLHCGRCSNPCDVPSGFICQEGECACIVGLVECGDPPVCVDVMTDPEHCGTCGTQCPAGDVCVNGACGHDCYPPNQLCGSECANPMTSNSHCGQCNNPCDVANGFICQDGTCDCVPALEECEGVCVNLSNDEMNCGSCGIVCPPAYVCLYGICGGDPIDPVELTCPDSEMPMGASMQCTAVLHEIGGNATDITDQVDWYWYECEADNGCADGPIFEDVVGGLVSTVDSGGTIGDRATIYVEHQGYTSNQWTIWLVEQPSVEDFIAGAVLDPCQDSLPICTTLAGCVLDENEYIEADFPGQISFIANATPGETLVVKLFFSTQEDPGTNLTVTFYDAGCMMEMSHSPLNDIFEMAGLDWTLEVSQEFAVDDLHLVEVSSNATTHYYLRVEIQ